MNFCRCTIALGAATAMSGCAGPGARAPALPYRGEVERQAEGAAACASTQPRYVPEANAATGPVRIHVDAHLEMAKIEAYCLLVDGVQLAASGVDPPGARLDGAGTFQLTAGRDHLLTAVVLASGVASLEGYRFQVTSAHRVRSLEITGRALTIRVREREAAAPEQRPTMEWSDSMFPSDAGSPPR